MRHKRVPIGWQQPIEDWAVSMRAGGRSDRTVATRTDHLRRAARALGGVPFDVTEDDLMGWVGRQDWRRETRRSVYASLRSFWGWAVATRRMERSPALLLPSVRPEQPRPRPTPENVYQAALAGADRREHLILRLAAETGLRRAEIAQVRVTDLMNDPEGGPALLVHGKGDRERVVPLPPALARAVRVACQDGRGGWMLPGDDHGHLSPRYVGILASRLMPEGWTLHSLRHRFATVAHTDRDLISVSTLLGHSNLSTTQRYVAVPNGALRRAMMHAAS